MLIESDKNYRIKNLLKLIDKSRERKIKGCFVVEGVQENKFALRNKKFILEQIYIQPNIFSYDINLPEGVNIFEVSQSIYSKVAYRKITEGIIGVYKYLEQDIEEYYHLENNLFILVVESIEKPGNLGAICRTADAFGVDLLIICDPKVDLYNPNVIRSSVGSIFNIDVVSCTKEKTYDFLKNKKINLYTTFMSEDSCVISEIDLKKSSAILFGTEHQGVSDFWKDKISKNIIIPMKGKIDSLNVSNAVAIASYEVFRQRI